MNSSADVDILGSLGFAVLERDRDSFRLLNESPAHWWRRFVHTESRVLSVRDLETAFPALESFIFEAQELWDSVAPPRFAPEVWTQRDLEGEDAALEVTAVRASSRQVLLLRVMTPEYRARTRVLEEARERGLSRELLAGQVRSLTTSKEELENRARESERVNRLKSELVASISHELRTPLNAMIGFSTLLLQGRAGELNPKQKDFVSHLLRGAHHLLALINDVLELSRIDAGRLRLDKETFAVAGAVNEVLSSLRPQAEMKGIQLTCECPEMLSILADRVRFKQILYNLLSNSIKFTGRGGSIRLQFSKDGEQLSCVVADNGVGIPLSEQSRIFDPFFQGVHGQATKEGTGLGLAVTKRLVEQHGGAIELESEPGRGACFRISLPLFREDADAVSAHR
jgi:signal transduction histidine kinase